MRAAAAHLADPRRRRVYLYDGRRLYDRGSLERALDVRSAWRLALPASGDDQSPAGPGVARATVPEWAVGGRGPAGGP